MLIIWFHNKRIQFSPKMVEASLSKIKYCISDSNFTFYLPTLQSNVLDMIPKPFGRGGGADLTDLFWVNIH